VQKIKKRILQAGVLGVSTVTVGLAAMAAQGAWRVYMADDPVGRNLVTIESRAPLETILTRTNQVKGEIKVNPENVLDHPSARFELDTASLETGIPMRDEHMRAAGCLDTAKYPKSVFTLKKMIGITRDMQVLRPGQTRKFIAEGELELHGVTKSVTAQLEVTPIAASKDTAARLPGDLLHVRATFPIKLDEFGIDIAPPARLKIANEQQVTADIFTSTELPKPPGTASNTAAKPLGDQIG
jgi:polyisoprenoid-binding protein YceI